MRRLGVSYYDFSRSSAECNPLVKNHCDSRNYERYIADLGALDVFVHKRCHLEHSNHSPTYWRFVKREVPDYDIFRQWLRVHAGDLEEETSD